MRQTSIDMYNRVKASGLLSEMRLKVYEILCRHNHEQFTDYKGLTALEMRYYAEAVFHYTNSEHLPKRLSELERQGVIEVVDTRECRRSGNTAIAWAITGRMPTAKRRDVSEKEQSKEIAIEKLRILWGISDSGGTISDESWTEVANEIQAI